MGSKKTVSSSMPLMRSNGRRMRPVGSTKLRVYPNGDPFKEAAKEIIEAEKARGRE